MSNGQAADELADLLMRSGRGERAAFEVLYERSAAKLFGVILRICTNRELVKEALQESFVTIWQKASIYDPSIGSPISWMARIARNQAIDLRRRRAERISELSDANDNDDAISLDPDQEASLVRNDALRRLSGCLNELPPERKTMILLAYYQGWSREELAQKFTRQSIRSRLYCGAALDYFESVSMAETERDKEHDDLAAEYVLGTLDAAERAEVERRLRIDVQLAQAVAAWEHRIEPLIDAIEPVSPPSDVFAAISARIKISASEIPSTENWPAEIFHLRRKIKIWRIATIAASGIAAALALFVGLREFSTNTDEQFVAVLEGENRSPAFVAAVNVKDKSIMVLRVGGGLAPAPGHSHELWALGGGRNAPQSLGLLGASASISADEFGQLDSNMLDATSFAVSLEPEGGSPTGQPTGPVVFSGKLVPFPQR